MSDAIKKSHLRSSEVGATIEMVSVEGDTRCYRCGDKIKVGGDEWQWRITTRDGQTLYLEDCCADASGTRLPRENEV